MRSVQEQLAAVLAAVRPVTPLDVVLADAAGCILAQDVRVPADVPSRHVAACEGYAVLAQDTEPGLAGDAVLPVAHEVHAADREPLRLVPGQAVRIATGGPLPVGADAVIPLADTDRGAVRVAIRRPVRSRAHVRWAGVDARAGDTVLHVGQRIGAPQLASAASLGLRRLRVHPRPRVVVISIGDELVEPGTPLHGGVVADANSHALAAAIVAAGATAVRAGIVPDEHSALREALEDQLVRADLVVLTGGLGDGARDTVGDVLSPYGTVRFDHVALEPGVRHGFGMLHVGGVGDLSSAGPTAAHALDDDGPGGTYDDDVVPVFALPGNPVAAQVGFEVFVRPALRAMSGEGELYRPSVTAVATYGWESPAGLRQFVPATLHGDPREGYRVSTIGDPLMPGIGHLASANAFAVVPEDVTRVAPGDRVACMVLDG